MMQHYDYLIVGGGMTADAAAHGIREVDPSGSIALISSESDAPYDRPPLSKALWKGEPESSVWRSTPTVVTLHLGRKVTLVDPRSRVVTDEKGDRYGYGSLLLATGGSPRRLPFSTDRFIYYRTLRDYHELRALALEHDRFAVLGGGFIGSEIAAALALNGKSVTMIFPEDGIGARVYPADLSGFLAGYYREKGVDVRQGTTVDGASTHSDATTLETSTGRTIETDAVIAGLGITPDVQLAERAGARVGDGILVDENLRTSLEGVFAAGDVANYECPPLGRRMRVEHEDNALTMGRAAGRAMAGDTTPYAHIPFFYSDLFDLGYEAVGVLDSRMETFADWKEPFREGVVYYLEDGRVRGVLLWNVWGKVDEARALLAQGQAVRTEELKGRFQ